MTNTISPEQLFNDNLFSEMIRMGLIKLSTLKELAIQCEYILAARANPSLGRDEVIELVAPKFGLTNELTLRYIYGLKKLLSDIPKFRHNHFTSRTKIYLSDETKAKIYGYYLEALKLHDNTPIVKNYQNKKLEILKPRKRAV